MYAVNVTSPVQLPLVSGCRNSGAPLVMKKSPVDPPLQRMTSFVNSPLLDIGSLTFIRVH